MLGRVSEIQIKSQRFLKRSRIRELLEQVDGESQLG